MSNLTCASGGTEASFPSATFYPQQYFSPPPQPQPPVMKKMKKRNLPGNPDPESEVIALSPNSLLATNRFICDVCNKGFKRDQNLQLHRRGHNLPWKLKQRNNKDVIRKKVYVCPEASCVHHDPTRALGDLTGIKKHFCRKHGEKKWKCDKCSKKYAVQSDWKAHSKTCGTREYKCDCGTIFSRRDSFITHRAFCDALAEENVRAISSNPFLFPHLPPPSPPPLPPPQPPHNHHQTHFINPHYYMKKEQDNYQEIPPWLDQDFQNPNPIMGPTHHQQPYHQPIPSPHLSATALLQKASQMGAKMGGSHQGHHVYADSCDQTAGFGLNLSSREGMAAGFVHSSFGNKAEFSSGLSRQESPASAVGGGTGRAHHPHPPPPSSSSLLQDMVDSLSPGNGLEGMTRDFFGAKTFIPH